MRYRRFGRLGWEVSEVGYGMWGMAGWVGSDDEQSSEALDEAVRLGCNFFDTAWAYGDGHSERLLGELVRRHPDRRLYVATKIPARNFKWPARPEYTLDETYPPDHIRDYVHRSLENLGLDRIDLIQFHVWDDGWADDARWQRAMDDLRSEGVVEGVGISMNRWEPWNGMAAMRTGLIDAVQVIHNIFDQAPEDELFPLCQELDVAVIARVPFDEGSLTGTLTRDTTWPEGDWRNTYFVPENLNETVDRVEALRPEVPREMSMPEMALRFILSHPAVSTVIPGMRRIRHVTANLTAGDAGPLEPGLLERLRAHRWDRTPTEWSQ
jgi:aryl-alcohol dehydrogenase-like predicted oxidoreductase